MKAPEVFPRGGSPGVSLSGIDADVLALVERGEEHLLRQQAGQTFKLSRQMNAKGRIELGITELSNLHAQLNSMTTQCTLIVGFALAGVGSDTLSSLASDQDQFCIYKTERAQALGVTFILVTIITIFFSMTVLASAQTIIAESNSRIFDYDEVGGAHQVVLMTALLMHGERSGTKKHSFVQISLLYNLSLFAFFFSTILAIWLFLGTNNYVEVNRDSARVLQPPNETIFNPFVIYTDRGRYKVKCSDPYNGAQNDRYDEIGTAVAWGATIVFFICLVVFFAIQRHVIVKYQKESLQELADKQSLQALAAPERGGERV